jgi:hypothetical protein
MLYIPGLETNHSSVTHATQKNIETTCTSIGCIMLLAGHPVLEAQLNGQMYELSIRVLPSGSSTQVLVAASFQPSTLIEKSQPIQV